ncbi:MAG: NAD-dependent protein deacylase [Chloroflexi bacterium]|nr:NAD-dependent protein deacylase [Chloroflexota bacterium]
MTLQNRIEQAADLIRQSARLTVLTGAGVSAESGIPTFRDALTGLWAQYDPTRLATPQAFAQDPKLVWDFYQFRRDLMRPAQPNPAHFALAAFEQRFPEMQIITQNIDDLHERAGSHNVIRLHGKMSANKCSANCQGDPTSIDLSQLEWEAESEVPACPHCGSPVRPDVVWFGEMLPLGQLDAARVAATYADVMLIVGTSGVVTPAADMPQIAKDNGATLIEFNPVESAITPITDLWLPAPAGETLPRVVTALDTHA